VQPQFEYVATMALADYAEPLNVTAAADGPDDTVRSLINGIYPVEWQNLPGVPPVQYRNDQFWSSHERTTGSEYLEIDLGVVRPINYLIFEATMKPFDIEISYDVLDGAPARDFRAVTHQPGLPSTNLLTFNAQNINPWFPVENYIAAGDGSTIYTRFLRIKFTRRNDVNSPFQNPSGLQPYSIEVRNLRVGRNAS
jgi:hypothetical protein